MPRPIEARIDLAAIAHNLTVIRRHARERMVWAVIKANAYGHGIERVLPALAGADGLALLDLNEAVRAREGGWTKPILLLEGFFSAPDLSVVERHRLTAVIHHDAQIAWLHAARPAAVLGVYLKLNTGMNRLGFARAQAPDALARLQAMAHVRIDAVMTHLASGEQVEAGAGPSPALQAARVREWLPQWQGPVSIANSAALLLQPSIGGDSVRPGIAVYGGSPASGVAADRFGLRPAMRLSARLLSIQHADVGEHVGYGGRFACTRPSRIGVVACGYADGYPRVAPDGTPVAVRGVIARLAGRVSMDMITIDLTDVPQAEVGDDVELWGAQVPIDTVAECAGTVGYELMCALAARVPVVVDPLSP